MPFRHLLTNGFVHLWKGMGFWLLQEIVECKTFWCIWIVDWTCYLSDELSMCLIENLSEMNGAPFWMWELFLVSDPMDPMYGCIIQPKSLPCDFGLAKCGPYGMDVCPLFKLSSLFKSTLFSRSWRKSVLDCLWFSWIKDKLHWLRIRKLHIIG